MVPDELTELNSDQVALIKNLDKTAQILTSISCNPDVQKEVYNAVNNRYEGKNRIMFRHLLEPEGKINSPKSGNFLNGSFRENLMKVVQNNQKGEAEDSFDIIKFVTENQIEIAWHYTQEWNFDEIPAITFNPMDNDSVNIGYKVSYGPNNEILIDTVVINDDYAFGHPVWIVDQHEALPEDDPNYDTFIGEVEEEVEDSGSSKGYANGSAKYNKIFIYQVRTYKDNFRGLFGGENEMYFRRAGSEVVLGTEKTYSVMVAIDRWAGRKEVWRTANAIWDENWQKEEVSQWLGVEAINVIKDKTTKISGDISLKLEASSTGKIEIKPSLTIKLFGWEFIKTWKNQVWYNNTKYREQFFIDNWRDAARHGLKDGRCIYLAGRTDRRDGVYFTIDVDAYNY